jgi:hypothetical protein
LRDVQSAARAMGLQIRVVNASTSHEINAAFATFVRERPDALFVGLDVFLNNRRAQLVNLASRYALPAIFSNRDFAEIGGLMSYGSDIRDAYRQVGVYVGRILKGAKPADLPVAFPTKFELIINLKTAKAIGLGRREFITLISGAAVGWSLAARAQQRAMPVIGWISSRSQTDSAEVVSAFRQGLSETGFAEGKGLAVCAGGGHARHTPVYGHIRLVSSRNGMELSFREPSRPTCRSPFPLSSS